MPKFENLISRHYVCSVLGGYEINNDDHYIDIFDLTEVIPSHYDYEIDVFMTMMITGYLDY